MQFPLSPVTTDKVWAVGEGTEGSFPSWVKESRHSRQSFSLCVVQTNLVGMRGGGGGAVLLECFY